MEGVVALVPFLDMSWEGFHHVRLDRPYVVAPLIRVINQRVIPSLEPPRGCLGPISTAFTLMDR